MLIHAGRRVFHFGLPTPHRSKAPVTGVDIVPRFLLSRALAPRTQRGSGKLALGPTRAGIAGRCWPTWELATALASLRVGTAVGAFARATRVLAARAGAAPSGHGGAWLCVAAPHR